MFFGYQSQKEMREANPDIADLLIKTAEVSEIIVAAHENCTGSIDGKQFLYRDHEPDFGRIFLRYDASFCGNKFAWTEPKPTKTKHEKTAD